MSEKNKNKNIANALRRRQVTGNNDEVGEMGRVLEGTYEEEVVGLPPITPKTPEQLARELRDARRAAASAARRSPSSPPPKRRRPSH